MIIINILKTKCSICYSKPFDLCNIIVYGTTFCLDHVAYLRYQNIKTADKMERE